jgi:Major Facilitator Superfamily
MKDMIHADLVPQPTVSCRGHKAVVLFTLCLGVLITQVDTSVVNLAIQSIGSSFASSITALQWVLDAYNLAYATLLLTGGLIADLYGRRLAFQLGAATLTVASLGCAFAPSVGFLIAARAAAGVGAALVLPASLSIVRVVWTDQAERTRALGVWASCNGLAFVIGPTLGGFCVASFGWPSVFLLVVPLALAALALAGIAVPESSDPADRHEDFPGQILGAIALGGLVYAGIVGHYAVGSSIIALVLSIVALPLFFSGRASRQEGSPGTARLVSQATLLRRDHRHRFDDLRHLWRDFPRAVGLAIVRLPDDADGGPRTDAVRAAVLPDRTAIGPYGAACRRTRHDREWHRPDCLRPSGARGHSSRPAAHRRPNWPHPRGDRHGTEYRPINVGCS